MGVGRDSGNSRLIKVAGPLLEAALRKEYSQCAFSLDWNPRKVEIHLSKHGVSFDDAMVVFLDPRALTIFDEDHSDDEERWNHKAKR